MVALGVAVAGNTLPAQAPPAGAAALTPHQRFAREIYEELVEINTVDSVGSVTAACEAMATRFLAAGFPAADVQVLVPPGKPTKGNLVVRYRGSGARAPLLLLAHLDVVAARREDWPRDPFTLHEENGFFLGRGTADDKAMAAIFVANVLRYKREGFRPEWRGSSRSTARGSRPPTRSTRAAGACSPPTRARCSTRSRRRRRCR
ncbi:MAG: M20/M25/M40 family metallo-hydrolase [Gemmatimonadaceae bacterium]|nr:M20/M25/M40 family metallo-hydrolase [Gemmatimonadaceae bacterium]